VRIFLESLQPAPVQLQWHGYPGTMGSEFVHYLGNLV
jgi:predicted O-linked N-acetylglucosamine transferase (SPINDLY family)